MRTAKRFFIEHVTGINNAKEPDAVVQAIVEADILTTAIGPAVLPSHCTAHCKRAGSASNQEKGASN